MDLSTTPKEITALGTVLAVCDASKIINPLFKNSGFGYTNIYIIRPVTEKLFYRHKDYKLSLCRKEEVTRNYYIFLNEIQITLEDPALMILIAPDDAFSYQTEEFKEFKKECAKDIHWVSLLETFYVNLNNLVNSYYSSDAIWRPTGGGSGSSTEINESGYNYHNTYIVNLFRLYLYFSNKDDWFWSEELINSAALFYYKANKQFLKELLEKVTKLAPRQTTSLPTTLRKTIADFIYQSIITEKH